MKSPNCTAGMKEVKFRKLHFIEMSISKSKRHSAPEKVIEKELTNDPHWN
jgi:hypothetical protein